LSRGNSRGNSVAASSLARFRGAGWVRALGPIQAPPERGLRASAHENAPASEPFPPYKATLAQMR